MTQTLVAPEQIGPDALVFRKYGKQVLSRNFHFTHLPEEFDEEFIVMGGTVVPSIVFAMTHDGNVLAVRQWRPTGFGFVLESPGGCPESGDNSFETAQKEFRQETGYEAASIERIGEGVVLFEPATIITPFAPFLARGCRKVGEPKLDKTEVLEVVEVPLRDWLMNMTLPGYSDAKSRVLTYLVLPILGYQLYAPDGARVF